MNFLMHVGLGVTDLARSTRFYCELLGFRVDRDLAMDAREVTDFLALPPPGGDLKAVYLYLQAFQLELMQFDPPGRCTQDRRMNDVGLTHLSIAVPDVEAVLARVEAFGGTRVSGIGTWAAMIRDPDGQFVELLSSDWGRKARRGGAAFREGGADGG